MSFPSLQSFAAFEPRNLANNKLFNSDFSQRRCVAHVSHRNARILREKNITSKTDDVLFRHLAIVKCDLSTAMYLANIFVCATATQNSKHWPSEMFVRRIPSSFIGRLASISKQIVREASNVPLGAVTRTVDPFASIKISSKCQVTIKPYNIHECPDGNLLRVSLGSTNKDGSTEWAKELDQFRPSIDIDGGNVAIDTGFQPTGQHDAVECVIEVPVAANLSVNGERNVSIEDSLCDTISVTSTHGNIATKSVRSKSLALTAENGNIDCSGMTLAQEIDIRTNGNKVSSATPACPANEIDFLFLTRFDRAFDWRKFKALL